MALDSSERVSLIHDLDMKHQKGLHKTDLVARDEEARRIKIRALTLRDENQRLKDKLLQNESRCKFLEKKLVRERTASEEKSTAASSQEARLKKQATELANLKAEVESLNNAVQDSGKALQEKFALSRELNRLKPEMEHLQSQMATYQAVIAEKNDLRRQLDSLEVELENEKRSKQRARNKEESAALEELRSQLDDAEKRLATEKREREKMAKEHAKELAEVTGQNERLDERISTLKSKLKNTQTDLKESQAELEKCRAELRAAQSSLRGAETKTTKSVAIKPPSKKRGAQEISIADMTIGTPGVDDNKRAAAKKRGNDLFLGEKSTFSITPFLNRTKNMADDSLDPRSPIDSTMASNEPVVEAEEAETTAESVEPAEEADFQPMHAKLKAAATQETAKPRGRPRKALGESVSKKKNMAAQRAQSAVSSALEKVAEEPSTEGQENQSSSSIAKEVQPSSKKTAMPPPPLPVKALAADADGKKKRRKLLGGANKTILEEDEGDAAPRPVKAQLGPGRKLKAPLGGLNNAFAGKTFSPLKRDRRGIGASFLV
ncbi:hypothetical protein B0I35DRAFT_424214 [Stachybotrys elegans]|uniref:Uncharacterized protein n=1 Tax=Stachybotrys elegans TaxID=80388 RepID=A0A8K0WTS7_9HYPO|nr:hypothetical protein B0I35DRAFT_424214 [Stachybotrys elegans]